MRDASTRQRSSCFIFLAIKERARSSARARLGITRAGCRVLVLLAMLLASQAGSAHAAEGPFVLIDLGTLGGTFSTAFGVNARGQVAGDSSIDGQMGSHVHAVLGEPIANLECHATLAECRLPGWHE